MCCRTTVTFPPNTPPELITAELERIMPMAGFERVDPRYQTWSRKLPPIDLGDGSVQDRNVNVTHLVQGGQLTCGLYPPIGQHTVEDHRKHALGGSILFKIAMTLCERMGMGVIKQASLVGACRDEAGHMDEIVAEYPDSPLMFENLCYGFRTVLLEGVGQEPSQ